MTTKSAALELIADQLGKVAEGVTNHPVPTKAMTIRAEAAGRLLVEALDGGAWPECSSMRERIDAARSAGKSEGRGIEYAAAWFIWRQDWLKQFAPTQNPTISSESPCWEYLFNDDCRATAKVLREEAERMLAIEPRQGAAGENGRETKGLWLATAMLKVRDNPEMSDAKIALHVGVNKSQLTRSRTYKIAAAIARKQGKTHKGILVIDPDTKARTLEAEDADMGEENQEEIDARLDEETAKRNATRNAKPHHRQ